MPRALHNRKSTNISVDGGDSLPRHKPPQPSQADSTINKFADARAKSSANVPGLTCTALAALGAKPAPVKSSVTNANRNLKFLTLRNELTLHEPLEQRWPRFVGQFFIGFNDECPAVWSLDPNWN
jgi:hypothetical protein